ncbi:MAG: division plane positioning ATPase MipZ [Alphaproteobacteria bacterium]|nr:division plane positioning ATPase MipZ [Alphaproteobacteria bacterium]
MTANQQLSKPKIIVLGNEKGGTGKSTTAMHLVVGLLRQGYNVGCIDLDSRQASLTRYVENRRAFQESSKSKVPMPTHIRLDMSSNTQKEDAENEDKQVFESALDSLSQENQYIVIDCPGSDRYMSVLAHSYADILITPLNDSFVDLDVLASVDGDKLEITQPSCYSLMVWEQRKMRAMQRKPAIDWVVMRNRLSNLDARNKRDMTKVIEKLSKRLSFRLAPGFGERVIFREMFLQGLTLLDFRDSKASSSLTLSHIAARQEVQQLFAVLGLDQDNQK